MKLGYKGIWLIIIGLVGVLIFTALQGKVERSLGYAFLLLFISLIVRHKIFSTFQNLLLILVFILGIVGWEYNLYIRWEPYDRILHFLTPAVFSGLAAIYLIKERVVDSRRWAAFLLIVSVGVSLGTLWEVIEWLAGRYTSYDAQGLDDAASDMILNMAGSISGAVIALASRKK